MCPFTFSPLNVKRLVFNTASRDRETLAVLFKLAKRSAGEGTVTEQLATILTLENRLHMQMGAFYPK